MHTRLPQPLAVLVLLACSPARSAETEWRLDKDSEGIQVSSRAVEGWSIREIRARSLLNVRLSSVVAVIADLDALHELTPLVAQTHLLSQADPLHRVFYTLIDMPWPVADRDAINQRQISQDPRSRVVTIVDQAIAGPLPPQPGLIRISRSSQQWTLSPVAEGQVAVEMRLLSDPGGEIPGSLINALSVSTPLRTLSKLRELAQRPPYRDARLDYIADPASP